MQQGFTMFELMITISIMVIIAALVLVNFPGFNRQVAIEHAAQEVSLSLRAAQARALAVQKFLPTGKFPQGYGVYFDRNNPTQYIIFADLCQLCEEGETGYGVYDEGEKVDTITLPRPLVINDLFAKEKTGSKINLRALSIVYYRPDPVIVMHGTDTGGILINLGVGDAEMVLGSSDGSTSLRKIVAWTTGQISVEK